MTPSKLSSFKHNEYVHKWLSTAQPESEPLRISEGQGRTRQRNEKRPGSHVSPGSHRRKRRHAENELEGPEVEDAEARRLPRKRQIRTKSSPPAPARVEPAIAANHRQYLDRITQERPALADHEAELDAHTNSPVRAHRPNSQTADQQQQTHVLEPRTTHDPSLKYARRPRHKTREDRYEYKRHEDVKKVHKITGHNKRSARRKSGAALNEGFQAPNVDSERLTLKQASGPGFLSKGKSSDPTTRRGIPDLTFSEMTFLNKRRDLDDARLRGLIEQERPKKTPKGSAQDVSEFFAQSAHPGPKETSGRGDLPGRAKDSNGSDHKVSPLRSARRRTLSEVSRGYDIETRSIILPKATSFAKTWHPDPHDSRLQHFGLERVRLDTELHADRATSYISWSPSVDHQRARRQFEEASEVGISLHEQKLVNTRSRKSDQAAYTVHPRSSVSNVSRAKKLHSPSYHFPLDRAVATAQAQHGSPRVYYSLDDLKSMAKHLGCVNRESSHDDFLLQLPRPCQRPHRRHSTLAPLEQHNARESEFSTVEVDMRSAPSKFAGNAVLEEHEDRVLTMSRSDNGTHGEQYDEPRHLSPGFAHARAHGLLSAGPTLWNEPPHILPDIALKHPKPRAEADERSYFEYQLPDRGDPDGSQTGHGLIDGLLIRSDPQRFTASEYVPIVGGDGLDAFDAELLQTVHEPSLDFDPRGPSLEPLLSPTLQRSRPPTGYHGRELNDYEDRQHQQQPRAATNGSFNQPNLFEPQECPRPQLLRPSEDQSIEAEPFTGFSRPCILY